MRLRRARLALSFACASALACGSDFEPKNAVRGVRILAASADLPYARPGETVRVEVLAYDGRPPRPDRERMRIYWFPAPCVDPPGDQYWGCYPLFEAVYPAGVDLGPVLHEGDATTIEIPESALDSAVTRHGERVATAYVFMVACAGRVERIPRRSGLGQNALPIGCIGEAGETLGSDDFIVGFTRVYVYESRRNALPKLRDVTVDGRPIDPNGVIGVRACRPGGPCERLKLDVEVADESAELDFDNVDAHGVVPRETVYVDWFTSIGEFDENRKILIDATRGRPPKTTIELTPPELPGKGNIWVVLHDNRGGTTWRTLAVDVR